MFYHVIIDLIQESKKINRRESYEIKDDITSLDTVKNKYTDLYQYGTPIVINGKTIESHQIERIRIFQSNESAKNLETIVRQEREYKQNNSDVLVVGFYFDDLRSAILKQKEITDDLIEFPKGSKPKNDPKPKIQHIKVGNNPQKVFIVHGRDESLIHEVQLFLSRFSIESIVLNQQINGGKTIIEKLLYLADDEDVGFAIVLYTPDDEGKIKQDIEQNIELKARARQNVIFEHGLLVGKLGRARVVSLCKDPEKLEIPNDLAGVIYEPYDKHGNWKIKIAREMKAQGYPMDLNLLF